MLASFFFLYVGFFGFTGGENVLPEGPVDGAIGGSVLFNTTLIPPETPFESIIWNFGVKNIGFSTPSGQTILPQYQGRATIFHSTGSLELRSLTAADSGDYGVSIILANGSVETGTTTLRVHVPVSSVTIDPETVNLVEFSDSLKLSCSSSGSSLSFLWIKDGSDVTASDRVQITDGSKTLTIVNVTREDQGTYTCKVSNPVSSATSRPSNVTVYYGPENIKLTTTPAGPNHATGSNITMVCSAESRPSAQFSWFLNGSQLMHTGLELKLVNVGLTQSGSYSCQAFNPETLRRQTSEPSGINIGDTISSASVQQTNLPVEGRSVNLTCEATGTVWSRKWMKDGSILTLADNMKLYDNNRVLSFTNITRKATGEYVCNLSNPISNIIATYTLIVNYGPGNVIISGKSQINVGSTIKLSCTADSQPLANFTWLLNELHVIHSPELFKEKANFSDSGTYTCKATNDRTGKSASAEHKLSVTDNKPEEPFVCDVGCIVGIVIACVVVIVAVVSGVYCFRNNSRKSKKSVSTNGGDGGQENAGFESQDVNYADIRFFRNNKGGSVAFDLQKASTDYAEVQVNNNNAVPSYPPTYDAHMERAKRPTPENGDGGRQTLA